MIPGLVSKMSEQTLASAATIAPFAEIVRVTGSTQVNTINPPHGNGVSQLLVFVPVDGAITLGTSGNILVGIAAVQNRAVFLVWSKTAQKWYINSGV